MFPWISSSLSRKGSICRGRCLSLDPCNSSWLPDRFWEALCMKTCPHAKNISTRSWFLRQAHKHSKLWHKVSHQFFTIKPLPSLLFPDRRNHSSTENGYIRSSAPLGAKIPPPTCRTKSSDSNELTQWAESELWLGSPHHQIFKTKVLACEKKNNTSRWPWVWGTRSYPIIIFLIKIIIKAPNAELLQPSQLNLPLKIPFLPFISDCIYKL